MSDPRVLNNKRSHVTTLEVSKPRTIKLALAYFQLGLEMADREDWKEARLNLEKALSIFECKTRKSVKLAHTYYNLALVWSHLEEYDKMRMYLLKAVKIYERKLPMSLHLAHCYSLLADNSYDNEDFVDAYRYRLKEFEIYLRKDPISLNIATTCMNLGLLLVIIDDLSGAQEWFEKALDIQESVAPRSYDVADTCSYLAKYCLGDEDQTHHYYEQALAILRQLQGTESQDLPFTYRRLACYMYGQGNRQLEREYYQKATELDEEREPSFVLVVDYFYLGLLSYEDGDPIGALQWHRKALAIFEAGLSVTLPLYVAATSFAAANSYFYMGRVFDDQGDYLRSLRCYQSSLDIYERMGSQRLELFHRMNPRHLPSSEVIKAKVRWNPSRLASLGHELVPALWCHVLAKVANEVQPTFYLVCEQPHLIVESKSSRPTAGDYTS